jgi:methionyl-tRNA synthetase
MQNKILVTNALPYANGSLHLGHILEAVQTDVWVRFLRSIGREVYYVCADDAHGAPIMLHARRLGVEPEELISRVAEEHLSNFAAFGISFDHYHSTHSEENRELVELVYLRNSEAGHITKRSVVQAYDAKERMFLSDRYIKGDCPRCSAHDQYGDSCEKCGATYAPTDLGNPYSVLSGDAPVQKESEQLFFKLADFEPMLRQWTQDGEHVQGEVGRKLAEWLDAGLRDWAISREAPYFGFQIPETEDKYFYVWVDAPIGYMASFRALCNRRGFDFDEFWSKEARTELYHFIGKDIAYFHTLFWPALLEGAGFRKPTAVFTHGFLTTNGEKMSKSRGTFISADDYLRHLHPEHLRYYFATKLGPGIDDVDLNLVDFVLRVNSDLIGKFVNIASRCSSFIARRFGNVLSSNCAEPMLLQHFADAGDSIAGHYWRREYGHAMREIMALADRANQYIDEKKPWVMAKTGGEEAALHEVCSVGINLFRILAIYLHPVLPDTSAKVCTYLNITHLDWMSRTTLLSNHEVADFSPLLTRVQSESVEAMVRDVAAKN